MLPPEHLEPEPIAIGSVGYTPLSAAELNQADRRWWDANAEEYLTDHGEFLGPADFCWGPEGLRESDAGLLGDLTNCQVLEIGAGAAQCSRWLARQGVAVVATDVSLGMLSRGKELNRITGIPVPLVQADARSLPFDSGSFDHVFTSFGAIPFVPDAEHIHQEVARVLKPGGTWTFSVTHPIRWAFPDDPSINGLTAIRSYFDRRPYVERDHQDQVIYAEFHRTLGDHVRMVSAANCEVFDIVEPMWPEASSHIWGGWGPVRGALIPGTAIFRCRRR